MSEQEKPQRHHYMILAEVVFKLKDSEDIQSVRQNGVMMTEEMKLPVRMIGKAQQIMQVGFMQRMQNPDIEILDVVLYSFTYLGLMTQEEFHAPPPGMKLQERDHPASTTPVDVPDLDTLVAGSATATSDAVSPET